MRSARTFFAALAIVAASEVTISCAFASPLNYVFEGTCSADSKIKTSPYHCSGGFLSIDQETGRMAIGLSDTQKEHRQILYFSGAKVGSGYQFSVDRVHLDQAELDSPTGFCVIRNIEPQFVFECSASVGGP